VSPRESNPDCISRRLRGETAIIDAVEVARSFAASQWLGDDELARLSIVVEEMVANLYDHGGLTEQDEVGLDLAVDPDGVRVSITDPGTPFDPWEAPRKAGAAEQGAGVGIDIVRAWAHFIGYSSTPEGNRLEFLLPVRWES
jgi:anti-sigma regulatory factor (Ser/Thr protein kinase)